VRVRFNLTEKGARSAAASPHTPAPNGQRMGRSSLRLDHDTAVADAAQQAQADSRGRYRSGKSNSNASGSGGGGGDGDGDDGDSGGYDEGDGGDGGEKSGARGSLFTRQKGRAEYHRSFGVSRVMPTDDQALPNTDTVSPSFTF